MREIYLFVFALLITLLICEVILHRMVKPSADSYGFLFDMELPPKAILPLDQIVGPEEAELTRNNWYYRMVVRGDKFINPYVSPFSYISYTSYSSFTSA